MEREKNEIDRDYEEADREDFIYRVRLHRQMTDEQRLARFFELQARECDVEDNLSWEETVRAIELRDREKDEVMERLGRAFG